MEVESEVHVEYTQYSDNSSSESSSDSESAVGLWSYKHYRVIDVMAEFRETVGKDSSDLYYLVLEM